MGVWDVWRTVDHGGLGEELVADGPTAGQAATSTATGQQTQRTAHPLGARLLHPHTAIMHRVQGMEKGRSWVRALICAGHMLGVDDPFHRRVHDPKHTN